MRSSDATERSTRLGVPWIAWGLVVSLLTWQVWHLLLFAPWARRS